MVLESAWYGNMNIVVMVIAPDKTQQWLNHGNDLK